MDNISFVHISRQNVNQSALVFDDSRLDPVPIISRIDSTLSCFAQKKTGITNFDNGSLLFAKNEFVRTLFSAVHELLLHLKREPDSRSDSFMSPPQLLQKRTLASSPTFRHHFTHVTSVAHAAETARYV
jgi:hypothetical protein